MALNVKPKDIRLAGTFFKKEFHTKLYEGLRMKKREGTLYEFFRQHGISLKVETLDGTPLPEHFAEALTHTLEAPPAPHTGHPRVKKVKEEEEKKEEVVVAKEEEKEAPRRLTGDVKREPKPKPKAKKVETPRPPTPVPVVKPEKKEHWRVRRARMLRPVEEDALTGKI